MSLLLVCILGLVPLAMVVVMAAGIGLAAASLIAGMAAPHRGGLGGVTGTGLE
jgi:hypothetical protein